MGQDIRELLKQDKYIPTGAIPDGHRLRFMEKLEQELPKEEEKKTKSVHKKWLGIAASVVVVITMSLLPSSTNMLEGSDVVSNEIPETKNVQVVLKKELSPLADMYPEYGKAEDYLLTSIKFQLSQIKVNDSNKELVESFMQRLSKLDKEYKELNQELVQVGPNIESVEAMMGNLRLRFDLLTKLKEKLKEIDRIENENYTDIQA